jgi:hypothetical protein
MAVKMDSADDAQNQNTSQEISSQVVATETGQCPMKNHHSRTLKNEALTTKLYGELRGVRVNGRRSVSWYVLTTSATDS